MKKGLKLFATGFVAMSALALPVNAEEMSVKIGSEEYATLKDAVDAVDVCTATAEECETTTINVVEDHTTSGIKIASGKYITIDLGGYTVNFEEPTVGSKGTETQDMQILKNSTITIKNGKMVSSDSEKSKMFIQNYANLTLENVEIDATNEQNLYAVSNNSGDVNIIGTTSIKAKRVAFDVCGYSTYTIGPKVVVNTTGTIEGDIEVTKDEKAANERPLSLLIENANHIGEISIQEGLESNVTIKIKDSQLYPIETEEGTTKYVVANDEEVELAPYETEEPMTAKEIETTLEEMLKEEDDEVKALAEEIKKALEGLNVVSAHEVSYGKFIEDNLIIGEENLQPNKKVEVTLEVPTTLEKVKDGYSRKYSVVRLHYNEETKKNEVSTLEAKEKDGKVTFETDKFSTYVLAYEDVKDTKNPNTGDNMLVYFAAAVMSVIGLALTTLRITKKQK